MLVQFSAVIPLASGGTYPVLTFAAVQALPEEIEARAANLLENLKATGVVRYPAATMEYTVLPEPAAVPNPAVMFPS